MLANTTTGYAELFWQVKLLSHLLEPRSTIIPFVWQIFLLKALWKKFLKAKALLCYFNEINSKTPRCYAEGKVLEDE